MRKIFCDNCGEETEKNWAEYMGVIDSDKKEFLDVDINIVAKKYYKSCEDEDVKDLGSVKDLCKNCFIKILKQTLKDAESLDSVDKGE